MAAGRIKVMLKDGSAVYVSEFKTGKPDGAPVWRAVMLAKEAEVFSLEQAASNRSEIIHWYNTIGKDLGQDEPEIVVEELKMRPMTPEEVRDAAADLADKIGFDACEDSVLYCRIEEAIREMSLFTADNE